MKTILIDMDIHPESLEKLRQNPNLNVKTVAPAECVRPLPREMIRDVDILFCTFPPENFSEMTSLEFMQIASAGYSQLYDFDFSSGRIQVCNAAGVNDIPIAEWTLAMMVNLARDLRGMIRNQQAGVWDRSAKFQHEIRGSTLGIWGYGGIGREIARLAKQFGLTIYTLDARPIGPRENFFLVSGTGDPDGSLPDKTFTLDQQMEFLAQLDFLVLTMPLTKATEGIIGPEQLAALPNHAFLLNPARGPLVQEQALLQALRQGQIAGAALDTHYYYPMPADHPLWRFPNVIMTCHVSGSTQSPNFLPRLWNVFLGNIDRFLQNRALLNQLSRQQLQND